MLQFATLQVVNLSLVFVRLPMVFPMNILCLIMGKIEYENMVAPVKLRSFLHTLF